MAPSEFQMWLSICAMAVSLGTVIYNALTSGSRKNEKEIRQILDDQSNLSKRIDRLENTVKALPDAAAVHRMELALTELRGDMRVLTTSVEPMKGLIGHINELLIENAKGKP